MAETLKVVEFSTGNEGAISLLRMLAQSNVACFEFRGNVYYIPDTQAETLISQTGKNSRLVQTNELPANFFAAMK